MNVRQHCTIYLHPFRPLTSTFAHSFNNAQHTRLPQGSHTMPSRSQGYELLVGKYIVNSGGVLLRSEREEGITWLWRQTVRRFDELRAAESVLTCDQTLLLLLPHLHNTNERDRRDTANTGRRMRYERLGALFYWLEKSVTCGQEIRPHRRPRNKEHYHTTGEKVNLSSKRRKMWISPPNL